MPDDLKTVMLTEREIDLVLQCISTNIETVKRRHPMTGSTDDLIQELAEMDMDIREQAFRGSDGFGGSNDAEHPDLLIDPVDFAAKHDTDPSQIVICDAEINAETQMFNAGVEAREKMKATSRAAGRRALNFGGQPEDKKSEMQKHDVWEKPSNDPADW